MSWDRSFGIGPFCQKILGVVYDRIEAVELMLRSVVLDRVSSCWLFCHKLRVQFVTKSVLSKWCRDFPTRICHLG